MAASTGEAVETTSAELMELVGSLRRTVRRNVRRGWPHRPLPESEAELLRVVRERPGVRVQEAATALGVAPNTVSTLVRSLGQKGLLERSQDPRDGRAARLRLTGAAARRIAAWRDRRAQIVGAAISALGDEDRRAIERAVPALRRLADHLERQT